MLDTVYSDQAVPERGVWMEEERHREDSEADVGVFDFTSFIDCNSWQLPRLWILGEVSVRVSILHTIQ